MHVIEYYCKYINPNTAFYTVLSSMPTKGFTPAHQLNTCISFNSFLPTP